MLTNCVAFTDIKDDVQRASEKQSKCLFILIMIVLFKQHVNNTVLYEEKYHSTIEKIVRTCAQFTRLHSTDVCCAMTSELRAPFRPRIIVECAMHRR